MKTKLEQYIEFKSKTIKQAAEEAGVSRYLMHYAIKGTPISREPALKIERWSGGFIPAAELVGLTGNR